MHFCAMDLKWSTWGCQEKGETQQQFIDMRIFCFRKICLKVMTILPHFLLQSQVLIIMIPKRLRAGSLASGKPSQEKNSATEQEKKNQQPPPTRAARIQRGRSPPV